MIEYFVYGLLVLFALSFVKIKGKRLINFRRFLFLLVLFPLILLVVLFSSMVIVIILLMFIVIFVIGYLYVLFGRKKRSGRVIVVR
ncbi:MAG: hypothetical protein V1914_00145 [archaeon]